MSKIEAKTATNDEDLSHLSLAGKTLHKPAETSDRFSLMIWGSSGCGKTTLAATAPGDLLWLSFDQDGTDSLTGFEGYRNIHVHDLAAAPNSIVEEFKSEDPLKLNKFLKDNPQIQTVVVDSLTTFGDKALYHGVAKAKGTAKGRSSTIEDPGYAGYGNKNTYVRQLVKNMLYVTKINQRNVIFIAHEDKPEKNDDGVVLFISIMIGGSLVQQVPVDLSEIWAMEDTGRERRIAVRPCRLRKPMKSRMFITSKDPEFKWNFDADTLKGDGIADWFEQWKENERKKISLPK